MAEWQLRDYTIEVGHLADFVDAWSAGVAPLRQAFGFDVQAWTVPDDQRFVWLLGHAGPGTFEDRDRAYYASPERAAVSPDPARWIAAQRVSWLTPILTATEGGRRMAEWALRDYTIHDGQFDAWLDVWRQGVLPIRQQLGFEVQAWAVPEESRFVWVLRYDGPGTYDDADRAYRTSPERAALDPEPADFIAEMRVTRLTPILTDGRLQDRP